MLSLPFCLQPTVEQFISMNRDINDGKDLPVDMLRVSVCGVLCRFVLVSIYHARRELVVRRKGERERERERVSGRK